MNFSLRFLGVTCASVIALGVSSVNASDISYGGGYKDLPPPPPVWAGFYAGINGGGSFGETNNIVVSNNVDSTTALIGTISQGAGFIGAQFGYNFCWGNRIVAGIETDIQGSGISGGFERPSLIYSGGITTFNAIEEVDYFGTLRGRIGYAPGNALFYLTAGLAYANINTNIGINNFNAVPALVFANHLVSNELEVGYAAGAGIEYKFTPNVSGKLEFQYLDFGSQQIAATLPSGRTDRLSVDDNFYTVRLGINYHFTQVYSPLK